MANFENMSPEEIKEQAEAIFEKSVQEINPLLLKEIDNKIKLFRELVIVAARSFEIRTSAIEKCNLVEAAVDLACAQLLSQKPANKRGMAIQIIAQGPPKGTPNYGK